MSTSPRNESDLYKVLGVDRGADKEEIRRAYKKLSLKCHPDKGGSEEDFKAVSQAYNVLGDDQKREMYDMTGSVDGAGPGGGDFPGGMPFPFDIGSIFGSMFGGGPPMGHGAGPAQRVRRAKAPPKVHEVPLCLSDFYFGKTIQFKFERQKFCTTCTGLGCASFTQCDKCGGRGYTEQVMQIGPGMAAVSRGPCFTCQGEGRKPGAICGGCNGRKFTSHEKVLDVRIEPGMKVGQTLVFERECSDNPDYMEAGDVHIVLQEADEYLGVRRENDTLHVRFSLSLVESLLGCEKMVKGHPAHAEGDGLAVKIPGALTNGNAFSIEKKGMPIGRNGEYGNLVCHVSVNITEAEKNKLVNQSIMLRAILASEESEA